MNQPYFSSFKALLLGIFILSGVQTKAQFSQKMADLKRFCDYYNVLSPFDSEDEEGIFEKIAATHDTIITLLIDILQYPEGSSLDLTKDIPSPIYTTSSTDGNLVFLSLDQKTGGTWRPSTTLFHAKLPNGTTQTGFDEMMQEAGASVSEIYLINPESHTYLIITQVTTCTTCCQFMARELTLSESVKIEPPLEEFSGRTYLLADFFFNPDTQIFSYTSIDDGEEQDKDYTTTGLEKNWELFPGIETTRRYQYLNGKFWMIEFSEKAIHREE